MSAPVSLLNKVDLPQSDIVENELLAYQQLGYQVLRVSAKTTEGLAELRQVLHNQVSVLTGQSGVGKSSITNAIIPDKNLRTNAISETTKQPNIIR
jgi:ribosome biogenesis GTPase